MKAMDRSVWILRQTGRSERRGTHHVALWRARPASEGVAGDQRKRVSRCGRQQSYIEWIHDPNHLYGVGALIQPAAARIKPFDSNGVVLRNLFKVPEPAGAMACQH